MLLFHVTNNKILLTTVAVLCLVVCLHLVHGRSVYLDNEEGRRRKLVREVTEMSERVTNESCELAFDRDGWRIMTSIFYEEKKPRHEVYQRMRVLLSLLRMFIHGKPHVEILQFWNWDKTIHIDHLFYVRVKTIWEVRRVIMAARSLGMRVRATGVGHTRSPLYVDEGNIMMDVRELQKHDGPRMELNDKTQQRDFQTVTAMTGVVEVDLNRFLTKMKVGILAQPLNDQETLGGMVAASTHGSTWNGLTYSGIVVEMRLMDSRGRLRKFVKEKQPKLFKAVMCNLGMFGIMYDITFKVVPTFVVKVENTFVPLKDLVLAREALREEVTNNMLTEISWFPFNSVQGEMAKRYEDTGEIPQSWKAEDDEAWIRKVNIATKDEIVGKEILGTTYMPTNGSLSGGTVVGLLRGRGAINVAKSLARTSFHYLVNAFPVILPPRWGTETSAAFLLNIDKNFDRVARALKFLITRTEQQIKMNGTTPLNALLPRFLKNHDCLLCPGNLDIAMPDDSGHSMVVDFLAPPLQYGFYPAAADFVETFKSEKIRPHWAKRHDNIDGIIQLIQSVYGSNLEEFSRQRGLAAVDPCDMFMNSYLIAIFGRNKRCVMFNV